ncbi:hypothetical protein [Dichelobacter nodosus]|uniref:hypothetical protein n=1 Tax=Dichelobacter nodosus TaxID=870 RepID=UPI0006743154|nr:hypothetical protein [Dichelobacter nodosus]KNZ40122.1 hypothetical protein AKG33_00145 [Dichelobacter nodosus]
MKYFKHVTVNTGHTYISTRDEVRDSVIETMIDWFERMQNGETINIYDDYSCYLIKSYNKMADFMISMRKRGAVYSDNVIRFTVCLHSRTAKECWSIVGGEGAPPENPFIAVLIINPLLVDIDLADFERCLAWGFYEAMQRKKMQ